MNLQSSLPGEDKSGILTLLTLSLVSTKSCGKYCSSVTSVALHSPASH